MHRSFWGLRPLDPHQGLCPWTTPGPLSGPLDPTPQGSCALRVSIFCTLRKHFLINGAPSHPLPTGTLEQCYATDYTQEHLKHLFMDKYMQKQVNPWKILEIYLPLPGLPTWTLTSNVPSRHSNLKVREDSSYSACWSW